MPQATFSIVLTSEQVLEFYKGTKTRVRVVTDQGFSMSLPYDVLIKYLTREGIFGKFSISYSDDGTLGELKRI